MRIGSLRHRIIWQQNDTTTNSIDEVIDSWSTFATVSCAMGPLSAKESFIADQLDGEISGKITQRYLAGLKPTMRGLFKHRVIEIVNIINTNELNKDQVVLYRERNDT